MALSKIEKDVYKARLQSTLDDAQSAARALGYTSIRLTDPQQGYSLRNTILLLLQAEDRGIPLTLVAGFHEWQSHGRRVMKGQPGLFILAGGGTTRSTTDDADDARKHRRFFGDTYVWDISQTEELPIDTAISSDVVAAR